MDAQGQATGNTAAVYSIEPGIEQLDHAWGGALVRQDAEMLDEILPDGFMFTDTFGEVLNKTEFLEVIKRGEMVFEILKREDVKLSVHWNTALSTGRDTIRGMYRNHDISGQYRFTNVYVEQGGRWKVVSSQVTRIAAE